MGLFSKLKNIILEKLAPRDKETKLPDPTPSTTHPDPSPASPPRKKLTAEQVKQQLDQMAKDYPEGLEWRNSIVDLMKLVGMDSSYSQRKEMAVELGYREEDIESKGSAEMNVWLHKKVLEKLAEDLDGDLTT